MGFLNTVINLAKSAWNLIAGIPSDIGRAIQEVWKFIGSVHALLSHLFGTINLALQMANLSWLLWAFYTTEALWHALQRVSTWIWRHYLLPQWLATLRRIGALKTWTAFWLTREYFLMLSLFAQAKAYAYRLVALERQQRIAADNAEHAAMLRAVAQALQTVQTEAASGYKAGNAQRASTIAKIADDLANRNPVIRGLVNDLITGMLDLLAVDNPLLRLALTALLRQVINRLGVDRVAGDLLGALMAPLLGNPNPKNLYAVADDLAKRVSALEATWQRYMHDGGPELDQAGRQYKSIASLPAEAALVAFFGLAVARPDAWARDVDATAGALVSGTIDRVSALIRRV
jgi:hypothetical protein